MEEIDELKCPMCKGKFDADNKIPRLLFNCGHTLCHSCIVSMIENNSNLAGVMFTCPEDDIIYSNITKAETFPKNMALVKIILKSEEIKQSKALQINSVANSSLNPENEHTNHLEVYKNPFTISEFKSPKNIKSTNNIAYNGTPTIQIISHENSKNNLFSVTSNSNTSNMLNNIRHSLKRTHTLNAIKTAGDPSGKINFGTGNADNHLTHNNTDNQGGNIQLQQQIKYCSTHPTRPLEIICIDHKIKLCTNCALFGEHKTHKIENEEDFIQEIEVKAEILIELFEMVDNNLSTFKNGESDYEELEAKNEEKKAFLVKQVQTFTEELINNLKSQEQKLINEISSKFAKIQNKILSLKEIPAELLAKSEVWKSSVQVKLDKLNEITETSNLNDEFGKLIEMNITDQEMITNAENIINEFEKIKSFPLDTIDKMIDSNNIDINYESANTLVSTAMIFINTESELDTDEFLTLDEDDKIRLEHIKAADNDATTNSKINTRSASELNLMGNINVSVVNANGNNSVSNYTNYNENNSFLNMSEDSAIIRLNTGGNYNTVVNEKVSVPGVNNVNASTKIVSKVSANTSSNNSPRTGNRKVSGNANVTPNIIPNNKAINNYSTNYLHTDNNISTSTTKQVNVIKLPNKKDNSKSPVREQFEKDKVVFIKTQFKNECANFTGYDIGEEGSKIITGILSSTNSNINNSKLASKVKELKLTKTNLTDETSIPIIKSLETNITVTILNLSKNYLTDKSVDAIVNLLNKNKILKSITLSGNNFSSIVKDKIKSYGGGGKMLKIFI